MATNPAQQVPIPNDGAATSKWVRAMMASIDATGFPSGMWAKSRCGALRQMTSCPCSHAAIRMLPNFYERKEGIQIDVENYPHTASLPR